MKSLLQIDFNDSKHLIKDVNPVKPVICSKPPSTIQLSNVNPVKPVICSKPPSRFVNVNY